MKSVSNPVGARSVRLRKTGVRSAVAATALALLVAACGGSDAPAAPTPEPTPAPGPAPAPAPEPDPTPLLEGVLMTAVVPYNPGGGYDILARTVQDPLAAVLGSTIVVENQPGAGGLLAINSLLAADDDGSTIAFMNGTAAAGALISGSPGPQFTFSELSWIARTGFSDRVIVARPGSSIEDVEALLSSGRVRFGADGIGAGSYIDAVIVGELLDLDYEIVAGFGGVGEIRAALLAGDIDLMGITFDSIAPFLESGEVVPILTLGDAVNPLAPDTKPITDIGLAPDVVAVAREYVALLALSRVVVGPPGMSDEVIAEISNAFETIFNDQTTLDAMAAANASVAFLPADEVRELAVNLVERTSARFTALLTQAYNG